MMGFKRFLFFCFAMLLVTSFQAQEQDSLRVMSFESYMALVKKGHPLSVQANLQAEFGDATVQGARGGFDPKAYSDVGQKYFKDTQYYSNIDAGVKIPTWFGLELMAGFEQNQGVFLNPESNVPSNGLWIGGVSMALGQGMFIDERRAALRGAQVYQESTIAERERLLNDLLFSAGEAYWDFFKAYNNLRIYQGALTLAQERFVGVKQSARLGDVPAIDTLEAGIQVQNRLLNLQQARLDFDNSALFLGVFLWADGLIPLELEDNTVPYLQDDLTVSNAASLSQVRFLDQLVNHPELRLTNFKIEQLEIEQRWKREQLKPEINLKYQPLNERQIGENPIADYSVNNYTWGLEFNMPLFLRKERSALTLAGLKIREQELAFENKQANLQNKAQAALNMWNVTFEQISLYRRTVRDYEQLLAGERRKFETGESSLFLVNSRELSYINAQIKLVSLLAENQKAILKTNYALGILGR
jgi:outer membrane protein TolC